MTDHRKDLEEELKHEQENNLVFMLVMAVLAAFVWILVGLKLLGMPR